MDSKTKTMLGIIGVIVIVIALSESADASTSPRFSDYLSWMVHGQEVLISQNDELIQQNNIIIELLKGNRDIFVAGITDRYIPFKWIGYGIYECFDRIEQQIVKHSCGLEVNLTRDQFNSMITGNPEN